jgi:hypothetical protein
MAVQYSADTPDSSRDVVNQIVAANRFGSPHPSRKLSGW